MKETITIQDIFKTIKKRLSLIVILTIIALAISAIVSYFVLTPTYQSSTQILVSQEKTEVNSFSSQDIETNLQLINTYNVIIKSPAILSLVIDELDLNTTAAALTNKITVSNAEDSQVVNITVQDPDPQRAVDIANKTAEVFQTQIKTLMQVNNVSVLTPAVLGDNPSPVKPDPMLNLAIAVVIGMMLGVGLAFLLEYLDTTVKTEEDIEEILNLPVLGLISNISEEDLQSTKLDVIDRRKRL